MGIRTSLLLSREITNFAPHFASCCDYFSLWGETLQGWFHVRLGAFRSNR